MLPTANSAAALAEAAQAQWSVVAALPKWKLEAADGTPQQNAALCQLSTVPPVVAQYIHMVAAASDAAHNFFLHKVLQLTRLVESLILQRYIHWGALVRSHAMGSGEAAPFHVTAKRLIEQLCSEHHDQIDEALLKSIQKQWARISHVLRHEQDDIFWLYHSTSGQVSLRRLNALASPAGRAGWKHLNWEDRQKCWLEILSSCKSNKRVIVKCNGATQTAWSCYCYCCCCCACSCFTRARWLLLQSLLLHQPRPRRYRRRQTVPARISQNPRQARQRRKLARPVRARRRRRSRVQTMT